MLEVVFKSKTASSVFNHAYAQFQEIIGIDVKLRDQKSTTSANNFNQKIYFTLHYLCNKLIKMNKTTYRLPLRLQSMELMVDKILFNANATEQFVSERQLTG